MRKQTMGNINKSDRLESESNTIDSISSCTRSAIRGLGNVAAFGLEEGLGLTGKVVGGVGRGARKFLGGVFGSK